MQQLFAIPKTHTFAFKYLLKAAKMANLCKKSNFQIYYVFTYVRIYACVYKHVHTYIIYMFVCTTYMNAFISTRFVNVLFHWAHALCVHIQEESLAI